MKHRNDYVGFIEQVRWAGGVTDNYPYYFMESLLDALAATEKIQTATTVAIFKVKLKSNI